jgi:hypothetical protein
MRTNQTTKNVVVNDRLDRTNVVVTLRRVLQQVSLCLRAACCALALEKRNAQPSFEAMYWASAGSPSWGGHCPSGGPGTPSIG